jgi:hypothetical protein
MSPVLKSPRKNNFLKAKTTLMAFDLKASAQVTGPLELFLAGPQTTTTGTRCASAHISS